MKPVRLLMFCTLKLIFSIEAGSQDIYDALRQNNLEQVKTLIEANPQLVMAKDETGYTPLHYAALQKQPEIMLYLIGKGADVNIKDVNLRTALHLSANSVSIECTRILIEKGADVKMADFRDQILLHYAAQKGLGEIAGMLMKAGSPINTGFELCPIVTPDGKYLIFLSGREGESHPFWVSSKVIDEVRPEN